jgi:hypothetical protein
MAVDISMADRLAGGVWGHLVGDALGVPYEGLPPDRIGKVRFGAKGTHHQPPGTWSDDGGLMLALLDSLLKAGFDTGDQGRRALAWLVGPAYKPGPAFSIGGTTEDALVRIANGVDAESAGGADERNNGNGSLMRILPIALVGSGSSRPSCSIGRCGRHLSPTGIPEVRSPVPCTRALPQNSSAASRTGQALCRGHWSRLRPWSPMSTQPNFN